jgi:hypothetical protein
MRQKLIAWAACRLGRLPLDNRLEVRNNRFRPSWLLFGDSLKHG